MKFLDNEPFNPIFCDNQILMAVKPFGLLTQPDDSNRESLEKIAKHWVKNKFDKPGEVFLHCIHRIDRPVFGLILFARTSKSLSRLNLFSREKKIERWYLAEVEGSLPEASGMLEHYLIHGDHKAYLSNAREGKKSILRYQVVQRKKMSTLIEIELETGRYHQIRAQFSYSGFPIVGDGKYGAKISYPNKINLACIKMKFPHPVAKKKLLEFAIPNPF